MSRVLCFDALVRSDGAANLFNALKATKISKMDKVTGLEVGAFIAFVGLSAEFVDYLAWLIAKNWHFVPGGNASRRNAPEHQHYLANVMVGFEAYERQSRTSSGPEIGGDISLDIHIRSQEIPERGSSPDTLIGDDSSSEEVAPSSETSASTHKQQTDNLDSLREVLAAETEAANGSSSRSNSVSAPATQSSIKAPAKVTTNLSDYKYHSTSQEDGGSIGSRRALKDAEHSPPKRRRLSFTLPNLANSGRRRTSGKKARPLKPRKKIPAAKARRNNEDESTDEEEEDEQVTLTKPVASRARNQIPKTSNSKPPTNEFCLLQLRGTHARPLLIDSGEDEDEVEVGEAIEEPLSPSPNLESQGPTGDGNIKSHFRITKPNLDRTARPHPAVPSRGARAVAPAGPVQRTTQCGAGPNTVIYEVDHFMARRREIDDILGKGAARRPEEWRGWREDWKARGVV